MSPSGNSMTVWGSTSTRPNRELSTVSDKDLLGRALFPGRTLAGGGAEEVHQRLLRDAGAGLEGRGQRGLLGREVDLGLRHVRVLGARQAVAGAVLKRRDARGRHLQAIGGRAHGRREAEGGVEPAAQVG